MTELPQSSLERKILIADVDPDSRVLIASVISVLGYTPVVVGSGEEAISEAQASAVDLVILDYTIADIDGVQVCNSIKAANAGAFIPVLMLTARAAVRDKIKALAEGVDEYITRPVHYEELQARVNALLRIRDLHRELRQAHDELRQMQRKLVEQERQLAVGQLAGAAAHQLGQPLSAILLNCYLIEQLPKSDARFVGAVAAIKSDAQRMAEMIDKLRNARASETESYLPGERILKLK
jgi:DNA-binding response OmpR family regulator